MPSSSVRHFADPEDYASSVRATKYQLTVTGRGQFAAELTWIDLHDVWMQRGSSNLPWVGHAANLAGRAIFVFLTQPGPDQYRGGVRMRTSDVFRLADGQATCQRAAGAAAWGSMSLPLDVVTKVGADMAGCDLAPPRQATALAPPPAAMERLLRLHAAAGLLASQAPEIIANTSAAKGLEQGLVEAIVNCLRTDRETETRATVQRRALVMRRFHEAVEAAADRPVYLSELCSAICVSDRTLRAYCRDQLGMGPIRYLWLRRMQLTRRALALAAPTARTVTDIATAHGFWELGRFAVAYRALYGESPSATLARAPEISTSRKNW